MLLSRSIVSNRSPNLLVHLSAQEWWTHAEGHRSLPIWFLQSCGAETQALVHRALLQLQGLWNNIYMSGRICHFTSPTSLSNYMLSRLLCILPNVLHELGPQYYPGPARHLEDERRTDYGGSLLSTSLPMAAANTFPDTFQHV